MKRRPFARIRDNVADRWHRENMLSTGNRCARARVYDEYYHGGSLYVPIQDLVSTRYSGPIPSPPSLSLSLLAPRGVA